MDGVTPDLQSPDNSDGWYCHLLLSRPGLHDDCLVMSSSLSLVDDNDDGC